jgi:diaminohydroxyphosphoribosylaminopyrimidine deaminase/5-amino-6-(5-phosphoribosylamino)uracil reductase
MNEDSIMRRVLELALKGCGVSPNPRVGALLVSGNRIISEGYHAFYGGPHAEIEALKKVTGEQCAGSSLYVNLEPCSHFGKTPPCTDAIIASGIKTVVYGMKDPNPLVAGKGLRRLVEAGIRVVGPVLETECIELNRGYIKTILQKSPWISLKIAQTLDGRIALPNHQSKWITTERSREKVQQLRSQHDAVLVGIGTVLQDDPKLTLRIAEGCAPKRIILDSTLRIPEQARVLNKDPHQVLLVVSDKTDGNRLKPFEEQGIHVLKAPAYQHILDLSTIWDQIINHGICSILVEGGQRIFTVFLEKNWVDQVYCFIAPKLFGDGFASVQGLNVQKPEDAMQFSTWTWQQLNHDLLFQGQFTCLQDLLKKQESFRQSKN